ncbi:hypothetical protein NO2_0415 [Candidatus Termititenax persephonae]|uniref:Uncharacterized protein n=1 Tax=Candidatus Termititenax persephonae TaxID=2218525 RepID=A0A388TG94_9BACT|nr:hypothetical protein NO2_0415 [Candidatus Termititenax persephonae]
MQTLLEISYTSELLISTIYDTPVWRILLWRIGEMLDFMQDTYNTTPIKVDSVRVGLQQYSLALSIEAVKAEAQTYYIEDNWLYVHYKALEENAEYASAQDWRVDKDYNTTQGFTDGDALVISGFKYQPRLSTPAAQKISSDLYKYDKMKFNTSKLTLNRKYSPDYYYNFFGNKSVLKTPDGEVISDHFIEKINITDSTVNFELKDSRARLTDMVVAQQPVFFNENGNNVVDPEAKKQYLQDAVGYCRGVPCVCLNGYAFDTMNKRIYRACFDTFVPDRSLIMDGREIAVEIEIENGWLPLSFSPAPDPSTSAPIYWIETVQEADEKGGSHTTTVICVPIYVAHPPEAGTAIPTYHDTPRRVRVTGWFHAERFSVAERDHITRPYEILRYLIERWSSLPYSMDNWDIEELSSELGLLNNFPVGIFIEKPTDFFNIIEKLQNGSRYGWTLCTNNAKLTARVDLPPHDIYTGQGRQIAKTIKSTDIMAWPERKISTNADTYASSIDIGYSRLYSASDEEANDIRYIDSSLETVILRQRRIPKRLQIDTLLKNEIDARARASDYLNDYKNINITVDGIKLHGKKWFGLRQYDYINIDLSIKGLDVQKFSPAQQAFLSALGVDISPDNVGAEKYGNDNIIMKVMQVQTDIYNETVTLNLRSMNL